MKNNVSDGKSIYQYEFQQKSMFSLMHCYCSEKRGFPHAARPLFCISYNVDPVERGKPFKEIDGFHKVARKHFSFVHEGKGKCLMGLEC